MIVLRTWWCSKLLMGSPLCTSPFVWTNRQQQAFEALKACLVSAPILGFPTKNGRCRAPPSAGSQLVVPQSERRGSLIPRFAICGPFGISRMVFRFQTRVYWPGLRQDVRTYVASCTVCLARKSPCPRRTQMGHVAVGRR